MAVARPLIALISAVLLCSAVPCALTQDMAPAPAPSNDGTSVDQGIACVLMLVALVLTYLIHPMDASSSNSIFSS